MGWNVKHPTKWVSYRLLHKTFWVSLPLEVWLMWFHGLRWVFVVVFDSEVRTVAGLLGGGRGFHDNFLKMSAKVNPPQSRHGSGETRHLWRESDQSSEKHRTLVVTVKRQNCYRKRKKAGTQSEMGMDFKKLPESCLGWCIKLLRARRVQFLQHCRQKPGTSGSSLLLYAKQGVGRMEK